LLAISLGVGSPESHAELAIFFNLLIPRMFSLGVLVLSWSILQHDMMATNPPDSLKNAMRNFPLAAAVLVCAIFSLAGVPLFAGFPTYYALWQALSRAFPLAQHATLIGCIGILTGGIRLLVAFMDNLTSGPQELRESRGQRFFLGAGIAILLVLGLFPQLYLPVVSRLAFTFLGIQP
jgi:NADH:ubiquinone oxidoreductase subunit 2 (subunit N)